MHSTQTTPTPVTSRIGFIPWISAFSGTEKGHPYENHLKVATLVYDRLLLPCRAPQLADVIRVIASDSSVSEVDLHTAWTSLDAAAGSPAAEQLNQRLFEAPDGACWDDTGHIAAGLRSAARQHVADELQLSSYRMRQLVRSRDHGFAREAALVAVAATNSASVWRMVQIYLPCCHVAFSPADHAAAKRATSVELAAVTMPSMTSQVATVIPSVGTLDWRDILALRAHRDVKAFRAWLCDVTAGGVAPDREFAHSVVGELWNVVRECRPNVKAELIEAVVREIPLPLEVNPVALGLTAKSLWRSISFDRRHKWLAFLHAAREVRKTTTKGRLFWFRRLFNRR